MPFSPGKKLIQLGIAANVKGCFFNVRVRVCVCVRAGQL